MILFFYEKLKHLRTAAPTNYYSLPGSLIFCLIVQKEIDQYIV